MRISGEWIEDPRTRAVMDMLVDGGYQAYFVGGCVRDTILGRPVNDIDISTDALPDRVMELVLKAGFHAIPTGIEHGTVTVMNGRPFEVTTFRKDIETDGRRAVVAFAEALEDDAHRRDLTMNALYADRLGHVTDPVDGLSDLEAQFLRFIGDAEDRIKEDYLRSLRYFRFFAWYGSPDPGPDPEALAAISANLTGIDTVSKERVGSEMRKLLSAPDPTQAVSMMESTGVLHRLLPGADTKALGPLVHLEGARAPNMPRRLAAIIYDDPTDALRLSRADSRAWRQIAHAAREGTATAEVAYRMGSDRARDAALVRAALMDFPISPELETEIVLGANAKFPVSSRDYPELSGPALGEALRHAESRWIASRFSMTKEELLA